MKKILAIAIVAIMTIALCVGASANFNLDRIHVNNNVLDQSADVKGNDPIEINVGDKIYILGWAFGEGKLKEVVYSIDDGADVKCDDNYRDRADVASAGAPEGGAHAGIGKDDAAFELTGIDKLKDGTYKLTIKAVYEAGDPETKEFNLKVGTGVKAEDGEEAPTTGGKDLTVDLSGATGSIDVKVEDGKVICTTNAADPWVSIPLDNVDTNTYKFVTVTYTADKEVGSNNTYLQDTEVNPGYSGTEGTWTGHGMAGTADGAKHSKTYEIAKDFPKMVGTTLTGIRFTCCGEEGGVFTVESVVFSENDPAQQSDPGTNPGTADASVIAIAAVACVALAGVVVAKKVR